MRVLAYDMERVNAPFRAELSRASEAVIDSAHLILGDHGVRFEQEFAAYCGTAHCVGVGNGLDALAFALTALKVSHGDEVIVPAFTFIATWFSVHRVGARPVAVDVNEDGLIDPELVEAAITSRTRAIVPVHLFGRLADMARLQQIAEKFGIPLVEDAAQAHGATYRRQRAGSFGKAAAFSFYPTKNLGALGDGGAVCTNDPEVALQVRRLRNYGSDIKYRHELIGQNSRLDELQAAFLSVKLRHLEVSNARRKSIAAAYLAALREKDLPTIALPSASADSVWHQFVIRTAERTSLIKALDARGIGTMIHYPIAPFEQPCFAGMYRSTDYPVAARLAKTVLSLPMGDYLAAEEIRFVVEAVTSHFEVKRGAA